MTLAAVRSKGGHGIAQIKSGLLREFDLEVGGSPLCVCL